jgi:hypothetical protein
MKLRLVVGLLLSTTLCIGEGDSTKSEVVRKSLKVISAIQEASRAHKVYSDGEDRKVDELVGAALSEINDPDQLVKIAQLSWAVSWPQEAGDAGVDVYFDAAFWRCVEKLSRIKGPIGRDALRKVGNFIKNDAGGSLRFSQYVSKQAELERK